jgi:hypothetical protein
MQTSLVKIKFDDDGNKKKYAKWCTVNPFGDGNRSLCSGEVFGFGESGVEPDILNLQTLSTYISGGYSCYN